MRETKEEYLAAYALGLRLLCNREHSEIELLNKLKKKASKALSQKVISELVRGGYCSNERFSEACCRSRVRRGFGPRYIARELRSKGVDRALIEKALNQFSDKWPCVLREGIENKLLKLGYSRSERCTAETLEDPIVRGKIVSSLERKGFDSAQILRALENY